MRIENNARGRCCKQPAGLRRRGGVIEKVRVGVRMTRGLEVGTGGWGRGGSGERWGWGWGVVAWLGVSG